MTVSHSNRSRPSNPYPSFPIYAASNGQWCRKIAGKHYSFGVWADYKAALKKHNAEYPFLKDGIAPPESLESWKVADVINEFLDIHQERMQIGEIEPITFDQLKRCCNLIVKYIPKHRAVESLKPEDFRKLRNGIVKHSTPAVARVNMSRIRSVFKFAYEEHLIDEPVRYGQGFKSPSKAMVHKARHWKPKKLFKPSQVKLLLDNASLAMKAMILLSINTGMNNADIGNLKERHIDFENGWLDYPRHKTVVERVACSICIGLDLIPRQRIDENVIASFVVFLVETLVILAIGSKTVELDARFGASID